MKPGEAARVLILGGTAEARALAAALTERAIDVISSLAGRVSKPRLPVGEVHIGGFGGVEGLAGYIQSEHITHVIDATHPFATTMTRHGVEAAQIAGRPFLRVARPGWRERPDSATWHWVASYDEARQTAEALGRRPFITTGRQTLAHYEPWRDRRALVRVVEPLDADAPTAWTVVLDRGPYDVDGELSLMRQHAVDVLLTKDSGGAYTAAKLAAARELQIPVVVVARPATPTGATEVRSVDAAIDWLATATTG